MTKVTIIKAKWGVKLVIGIFQYLHMLNSSDSLLHLSQEVSKLHAGLCSALADPTRILILYLLGDEEHTVSELTDRLNAAQPTISRHLKILRDHGLVYATRQGQTVEYSLNDPRIIHALDILRDVLRDTLSHRASLVSE